MAISERDMLEAAEYFLDILDKAKAKPDRFTEIPNGMGQYETVHGEWMDRAKTIINHRKSQYIDNGPKKRFGPGGEGSTL
jgi:hypothetical protein